MGDSLNQIILLAILVATAGFFSASETALFSLRNYIFEQIEEEASFVSKYLKELLARPRELIITLVFSNELVNSASSVVIAGMISEHFGQYTTSSQVIVATLLTTTLIIIFADLIPKSIGMANPKMFAIFVSIPLRFFFKLFSPIRKIFITVVDGLIRVFKLAPVQAGDMVKEEEFRFLVDESTKSGELDEMEAKLIHRVFDFGDKMVGPLCKDIKESYLLDLNQPLEQIFERIKQSPYSRIPVYNRDINNVIGVLHKKVLLKLMPKIANGESVDIKSYVRRSVFIFPKWNLYRVLRIMRQHRTHMAFTVSEYGDVLGVLTLDDLLKQLFGEWGNS